MLPREISLRILGLFTVYEALHCVASVSTSWRQLSQEVSRASGFKQNVAVWGELASNHTHVHACVTVRSACWRYTNSQAYLWHSWGAGHMFQDKHSLHP